MDGRPYSVRYVICVELNENDWDVCSAIYFVRFILLCEVSIDKVNWWNKYFHFRINIIQIVHVLQLA